MTSLHAARRVALLASVAASACGVDDEVGGATSSGALTGDSSGDNAPGDSAPAPTGAPTSTCGNGQLEDGEDCEPGLPGPACASDCAFEPGALLWRARHDGPAGAGDYGYAVAVAPDGGVLVVGDTYVDGDGGELWLARYEPDGALTWSTHHGATPGEDYQDAGRGLAVGAGGEIFVTGFSYAPGTGFDVLIARFDADGALAWSSRHDGPASGLDAGAAIVVDREGAVIVAGTVDTGAEAADDVWIARLRPDGVLTWETRYDHGVGGNDRAGGLALAPDGLGFALAGSVEVGAPGQLLGTDAWLARYDGDGQPRWSTTFAGPQGDFGYDAALAVAFDPEDEALVTAGYVAPAVEASDSWVARYDASGALQWSRTYSEPTSSSNVAYALALGERGDIVAAGFRLRMNEGEDVWVRKYTPDGEPLWTRTHDDAGFYDIARGVAVDEGGRAYVTGFSFAEATGYDVWLGAFAP